MKRSIIAVIVMTASISAHAGYTYGGLTSPTASNYAFGRAYTDAKNNQSPPANSTTVSRSDLSSKVASSVGSVVGTSPNMHNNTATVNNNDLSNTTSGSAPGNIVGAVTTTVSHNNLSTSPVAGSTGVVGTATTAYHSANTVTADNLSLIHR